MSLWSDEQDAELVSLAGRGLSANEIGGTIGRSKNAVIGRARRLGIPLLRRPGRGSSIKAPPSKPRAPKALPSNVFLFPGERAKPRPSVQKPKRPVLRVIVNTEKLVEDWLKKNGGARRFSRGETGDRDAIKAYLESYGYRFRYGMNGGGWQRGVYVAGKGANRKMTWREITALADRLRVAEGLEPILSRSA